ncbi:ATP-dependent DNA ligase [Marivirga sp. S37H4]|uniref:DNA ligase (ATP) n=1 Tax=Marivirga aurantiaca TaxID=2802615 RepID=A0A935C756_9BACT|nr:ATP-dependent DNA ligase [Marivirga aurantiaca]MBK6264806.1 ATP-dependent DNA ligase [Marivirga aurantiaca]
MKDFAELITSIDQSNKTNDKVAALKSYFSEANDADKIWVLALFTNRRPKRKINSTLLKDWVTQWAAIPSWLFQESYHVVGDLAETIALILPFDETKATIDKPLHHYIHQLIEIGELSNEEKEIQLKEIYGELNTQERFVFTKLMTGSWRLGVSQNIVTRAISQAYNIDKTIIAHRLMGNWTPQSTSFSELILEERKDDLIARPYPFFLAHPVTYEEVKELGHPKDWQAEWKWDGIRGQIIKRKNEVFIWSRGEELVTEKFPELVEMSANIPNGTVLDGEILPYQNGEPLPFALLQTRIGRKNLSKAILKNAPVVFKAYDILEYQSQDIRSNSLQNRNLLLEEIIRGVNHPNLQLSAAEKFNNWEELAETRTKARSLKTEGFMLKKLGSAYEVGRKRGGWWKWKIDPLTIDGVLIYAQKGHGRRADLYSDYTFGVWRDNELIPFAKAYSGLTDAEMRKVNAFVKNNTKERFGPVRTVTPQLVFEIAFEGIQESKRHKSGIALRFPRISRWREDKKMEAANTLGDLQELLEKYG